MPGKVHPDNAHSTLMSKVTSYMQAVEEDEDSQYHLKYLLSLQKQIEGKMEKASTNKGKDVSDELTAIHELLETFIPYHSQSRG